MSSVLTFAIVRNLGRHSRGRMTILRIGDASTGREERAIRSDSGGGAEIGGGAGEGPGTGGAGRVGA